MRSAARQLGNVRARLTLSALIKLHEDGLIYRFQACCIGLCAPSEVVP